MGRYMRNYEDDMYMRNKYNRDGYVFAGMLQDYDDFYDDYDNRYHRKRYYRAMPREMGGRNYQEPIYRHADDTYFRYPKYWRDTEYNEYRRDDYPFDDASVIQNMVMEAKPDKKEILMSWVKEMKNTDGTRGAHFSEDTVKKLYEEENIKSKNIEFEDYFATMNMFYSDFGEIMKNAGISDLKTYSLMSVAFIKDEDAAPEKVLRYALFIPKD